MKNINFIMVTALLLAFSGLVVADTSIEGIVYDAYSYDLLSGANVKVTCDGNELFTTTQAGGHYDVTYNNGDCPVGTTFYVEAEYNGLYGYSDAVAYTDGNNGLDLGVANVAIVPEFGLFLGILTMLSAVGIFFVVRKE